MLHNLPARRINELKIVTLEEPVEVRHPRFFLQVGVEERIGRTFSELLRHVLRHDPDVVLVGETRDRATAEITLRAALTGRLCLSTLHTNDALGAVVRLVDLGLDPVIARLGPARRDRPAPRPPALPGLPSGRTRRTTCSSPATAGSSTRRRSRRTGAPSWPRPPRAARPAAAAAIAAGRRLSRSAHCGAWSAWWRSGRRRRPSAITCGPAAAAPSSRTACARRRSGLTTIEEVHAAAGET